MSSSKMTLIGQEKYLMLRQRSLFELLELPEGIDKETLTDNILLQGAEFEVIYPDVDFMVKAIGSWSKKWNRTFTKWIEALNIEYNPLENYDRKEDWTDSESSSSTGHSKDTNTSSGASNVSAYDSDSMRPDTSSSTNTNGQTDLTNNGSRYSNRSGRLHGNIGVTTSQQMLESELDIAKWNIYEHITDLFLQDFVIPLY